MTPFILLCLIGFIAFFSSYIRMPVMPLYAASLGADSGHIGMINGSCMLTVGIFSIPAGILADRVGRKPLIFLGTLAVAMSSLLMARCHLPIEMAAAYVFFGVGLAAFAPGMLSLVADVMPSERLGQAYGWYTTAIYAAMTIGPATGGFLAKMIGLREVFVVSGILSLVVALIALLVLPSGITHHKPEFQTVLSGIIILSHNRFLRACLVATVGSCIGFGVFLTFLPLSTVARGFDPSHVGIVLAAQALTNVVCRVPIGIFADTVDRRWIVSVGLILLAAALIELGRVEQFHWMIVCAIVLGIGMALTYTSIGAMIAEKVPAVQRGLAMGMYNSCIYLGMMFGSTFMGIALKKVSYPLGFALSGGAALIALVWFLILLRSE